MLDHAVRDDDVRALATTREAIERLWDVCQVPDYRKIAPATHAELVITLFRFLMRDGAIPDDWFARQVSDADHTDGDIDTLSNRIAHIRTWTFAANRPDWLADPEHWQGVTRAIEDKLSDALHERLTERFVDRRTSVLMRRLHENTMLETDISKTGEVVVEGHAIGRLDGFSFTPAASAAGSEAKALAGAAQKALAGEIEARAARLAQAARRPVRARHRRRHPLDRAAGRQARRGRGRAQAAAAHRSPTSISAAPRATPCRRGSTSGSRRISRSSWARCSSSRAAEDITGIARGVAFQLTEALGVLERAKVAEEVKGLDQPTRATLRKYGVRFGAYHIYLPPLLKPAPRVLAAQLWALKNGGAESKGLEAIERLAATGRTVDRRRQGHAQGALPRSSAIASCGERAVRVDILERLADLIRPAIAWREGATGQKPAGAFDGRGFTVTIAMTSLAGCSGEDFASVLRSLGYRMDKRPKPAAAAAAPRGRRERDRAIGPRLPRATAVAGEAVATTEVAPSADISATASDAMAADTSAETTIDTPPAAPAIEMPAVEWMPWKRRRLRPRRCRKLPMVRDLPTPRRSCPKLWRLRPRASRQARRLSKRRPSRSLTRPQRPKPPPSPSSSRCGVQAGLKVRAALTGHNDRATISAAAASIGAHKRLRPRSCAHGGCARGGRGCAGGRRSGRRFSCRGRPRP